MLAHFQILKTLFEILGPGLINQQQAPPMLRLTAPRQLLDLNPMRTIALWSPVDFRFTSSINPSCMRRPRHQGCQRSHVDDHGGGGPHKSAVDGSVESVVEGLLQQTNLEGLVLALD